ncbi:MAG: transcriptional regulator [Bacteroides sp.]|nr:transcriptional regulator [Bacteroides sp.]
MKRITFLLFLFGLSALSPQLLSAAPSYDDELAALFNKLDSLIEHKEIFTEGKEKKIHALRMQKANAHKADERYWVNKMLYDEYFVHDADSAMACVEENMRLCREMGKEELVVEWKTKKSFLLSATGLLKEAMDALQGVSGSSLPYDQRIEYYGQMVYLYSHLSQYTGDVNKELQDSYLRQEQLYKDSINAIMKPDYPYYHWYRGWGALGTDRMESVLAELEQAMSNSSYDTRRDAMTAYVLARFHGEMGHDKEYMKYMICSAMADLRIANKDIASLEELASVLFQRGDIDRAYIYINHCLQCAQDYRNRVRVVNISNLQNSIHKTISERSQRQETRLHYYLIILCILSAVLLAATYYIYRQMKHLARSRSKLNEANRLLNTHVEELSTAHRQLAEANNQLLSLNEQLTDSNNQLRESNYVKEEYIGYVFSICSNYISKLDEYRKNINRKLKAKQFDELKSLTDTPTMAQNELKEFYHNFDLIFLHVYPDFVNDFNALLQPEERIVLKEGELLNTELRIYALVRLGINDSVKIAEFLHCSPQTVYNNRLRTRNKSIIPKEEFAQTVRSLGKMRQQ